MLYCGFLHYERNAIDKILVYDKLAERYSPRISDPVKARDSFRREVTGEEIKEYIGVWFDRFLKHPLTYVKATLNQNYLLLYPFEENIRIYEDINVGKSDLAGRADDMIADLAMAFPRLNDIRAEIYKLLCSLPITGLMSNVAVYNICMLFMLAFAIGRKDWKMLIIAVPLLVSDLIIVAAPVVSPRYTFPIIYAMPILVTYYSINKEQG